ncbi:MAG TPA: hypothetical protein VFE58_14460 [Tepidisphaeraceae bacterium]|nr:hypothetical protein [Tepidisphaeraceae bacterium]
MILLTVPMAYAEDDAPAPATRPATAPTTLPIRKHPSTKALRSEPERLLALAQFFIDHKSYPPARQRLETIIKNYPDDPTAKEAQALLDTISQKPASSTEWHNTTQGKKP